MRIAIRIILESLNISYNFPLKFAQRLAAQPPGRLCVASAILAGK
jgi:hypothetical protein